MIPYSRVFDQISAALNTSSPTAGYTGQSEAKLQYSEAERMNAILNEEARIWVAIAHAVSLGRRVNAGGLNPDIIKSVDLNDGQVIPTHIGPLISVEIGGEVANKQSSHVVTRLLQRNVLNLKMTEGLWAQVDNILRFTGTGPATVRYFDWQKPAYGSVAAFLAAESMLALEFEPALVDLATGRVMPREGNFIEAANKLLARGADLVQMLTTVRMEAV